jgi:hypothetical protein
MRRPLFWILLVVAVVLGLAIAWVDSRPTWDDTGITVGSVLIVTGLLGLALPERAWLWALAAGAWIPIFSIALHRNFGSLLALVIAFAGAYAGYAARKVIDALFRASAA